MVYVLKPSSAFRRNLCPGSFLLEFGQPDEFSEYAEEGQKLHELACKALTTQCDDPLPVEVQGYIDFIKSLGGKVFEHVEKKISIPRISQYSEGTPDYVCMTTNGCLHVVDFKTGYRKVHAVNNLQLLEYAIGYMDYPGVSSIILYVYQPSISLKPAMWELSISDLNEHLVFIKEMEELSLEILAPRIPSVEACKYCKAKNICPDLKEKIHTHHAIVNTEVDEAKQLENLYELKKFVDLRLPSLEKSLKNKILKGDFFEGFFLEKSYGREKWTISVNDAIELGKKFGADISKPEVLTPKQAIKAGIPEETVRQFSVVEENGHKLIFIPNG